MRRDNSTSESKILSTAKWSDGPNGVWEPLTQSVIVPLEKSILLLTTDVIVSPVLFLKWQQCTL